MKASQPEAQEVAPKNWAPTVVVVIGLEATALMFQPFVGLKGFTHCADESFFCAFSGMDVAYDAQGRFAIRTLTDGVSCTNGIFGDPNIGVYNACYVRPR